MVQDFIGNCSIPDPPSVEDLRAKLVKLPEASGKIRTVIAIDGGMNETFVREEFPSASIAFIILGPLLLYLDDLAELDASPFIAPEDMSRLRRLERYSLALPTRGVMLAGCTTFAQGVRKSVQDFLLRGDGHLMTALQWLLFREWLRDDEREPWEVPRCPDPDCWATEIRFRSGEPLEKPCLECGEPIYLADGLRLYERIDEETGASGIMSYLLTALEQIILVHVIRSLWELKPTALSEVLFVKDGPLAFFGVTAPLYKPMRDLMAFLGDNKHGSLINLVGLEKSGPFVEHAALIEDSLVPGEVLVLDNEYIYRHIEPGDAKRKQFGKNTYYGAKAIFRGEGNATYVATVPTLGYKTKPELGDLLNAPDVLGVTDQLRCSMYDNALLPIVLANRLVSLADLPSTEILKKFAKDRLGAS